MSVAAHMAPTAATAQRTGCDTASSGRPMARRASANAVSPSISATACGQQMPQLAMTCADGVSVRNPARSAADAGRQPSLRSIRKTAAASTPSPATPRSRSPVSPSMPPAARADASSIQP